MTRPEHILASEQQVNNLFTETTQFSLRHNDAYAQQGPDPFGLRHVRVESWEMPETTRELLPDQQGYILQPRTDSEGNVGLRFTAITPESAHHVSYNFPDTADTIKLERKLTQKPYSGEEVAVEPPEHLRALGALGVSSIEADELLRFMQQLQDRVI